MLNAYQGSPIRSLPPLVGRSEREPPQDGSEYTTIELIALRLRDALRRRVLSTPSDDGKPQTPAAFGKDHGFRGCQRTRAPVWAPNHCHSLPARLCGATIGRQPNLHDGRT